MRRSLRSDDGFTLAELMIVVLVIGILIAIALPSFLGARERARDRASQASLRNAVTNAKVIYVDKEDFAAAPSVALTAAEPSLTFKAPDAVSADAAEVSAGSDHVGLGPKDTRFVGSALSDTGVCWYVQNIVTTAGVSGTKWARDDQGGAACKAGTGLSIPPDDPRWHSKPADATDIG